MQRKECNFCFFPYPYMCSECCDLSSLTETKEEPTPHMEEKKVDQQQKKLFIGSGEDVFYIGA